jgi:hypothetical protein
MKSLFKGGQRLPEHVTSGVGRGYQHGMNIGQSPTWSGLPNFPGEQPGKRIMAPKECLYLQIAAGPASSSAASKSIPSVPRGPPRKPKQSGHALWVGNLPPGTLVNDLKDHFSRDATTDIESVFLISKSNCAFVNYKSEDACAAAMTRFHDSRFQGVRLVCRLRRTPTSTSPGVPTGPAALSSTRSTSQNRTALEAVTQNREESSKAEEAIKQIEGAEKINDKYFIVKSLTIEDLELSARNGIWATQSHNEETLNKAYEVSFQTRL